MITDLLPDGTTLNVYAHPCNVPHTLVISFNRDGFIGATGQGLVFRIFSKVMSFVRDLHRHDPATGFIISADESEPSRVSLYSVLARKFAKSSGMHVSETYFDGERFFVIVPDRLTATAIADDIADGLLVIFQD